MTSGEHTKGHTELPWIQAGLTIRQNLGDGLGPQVARVAGPEAAIDEDCEANANLIVTAVNTYPAVAELVKALEELECSPMMVGVDSFPNSENVVGNIDCKVLRSARSALTRFREAQAGGGV